MKWTLLFFLLLTGHALGQNTIILQSDPIILKPKRTTVVPQIRILEPQLNAEGQAIVDRPQISVSGVVTGQNGVERIQVDETVTPVTQDGGFTATVNLHPGINTVTVLADDKFGNTGKRSFRILCDLDPPVIQIQEPRVNANRALVDSSVGEVTIRGTVLDDAAIKSVVVNNAPVATGSDGTFAWALKLTGKSDSVSVVACDYGGRTTRVTFVVETRTGK